MKKKQLVDLYNSLNDKFSEIKESHSDIICHKGCSRCCTRPGEIFVSELEWSLIKDFLDFEVSKPVKSILKTQIANNRLTLKSKVNSGETDVYRILSRTTCPFLVNNACGIYSARPYVCRIFGFSKREYTKEQKYKIHTCALEKTRWSAYFEKTGLSESDMDFPIANDIGQSVIDLNENDKLTYLGLKGFQYFFEN